MIYISGEQNQSIYYYLGLFKYNLLNASNYIDITWKSK